MKFNFGQFIQCENLPVHLNDLKSFVTGRHFDGTDGIKGLNVYLAFSFFRLAAILQGVYKRGLDGNASNERATRMGRLVQPLAEMGRALTV